jgi:alpha-tubulin suppressor-like RCC1 family protein
MRVVLALTVILLNYLCEAHNTIYEWGKLNNSTTPQRQPYLQSNPQLFASTVWRQIAYGNAHQLYLTQDGKLYSAGSNSHVRKTCASNKY